MSPTQVTKIVALGLSLALTACKDRAPRHDSQPAGLQSKTAQKLINAKWCRKADVDTQGHFRVERFTFRDDGAFTLERFILNTDSSLTSQAADKGSWAVLDNTLVLMREGRSLSMFMSPSVREADGAACMNLTTTVGEEAKVEQICVCTL